MLLSNTINIVLLLSFLTFVVGIFGLFTVRRNVILIMISIELLLLSVAVSFVCFSLSLDDFLGQLVFLFIISLAGAEAAIGLSLLIVFYRMRGIISLKYMNALKG